MSLKFGHNRVNPRNLCFTLLILAAVVICRQSLVTVWQSAVQDEQRTHILLVLPVSVLLLYLNRARVFHRVGYDRAGGIALGLVAAGWVGLARYSGALKPEDLLSLSMLALVGWWTSAFLLCYGKAAFRSAAFPLLFLILLVAIPEFVLSRTIWILQRASADVAYAFLRVAQVPVLRKDVILSLPGIDIEVAQECSGIRSSLMLFLVSLVLGHLFLQSGWRKFLLTVAVFPITVVKNGLRIFTLSTLAVYVDPSFLQGWLHHSGGFIFFGLAMASLMLMVWVFHTSEKRAGEGGSRRLAGSDQNPVLSDGRP